MISNINQIKSPESKETKSESLFNNIKKAVNNVINPSTGKHIKDITAATLAALLLFPSCRDDLDTTPPRIDVIQKNIEISGGEALRVNGNQVYIGNTLVFRCSDDVSENPTKSFTFSGNPISPGYSFDKSGSISMKATDEAGNVSNASSQINKKEVIDEIKFTVLKSQVDFSKGGETSIKDKAFFVGNEKVVTWTDDNYTPSLKFDGKDVEIGYVVENEGVLTFTLTNDKGVSKSTNINIVNGNEAPEIQIKRSEANIFGGVKITLKDNQLLFGNVVMAEGTDDNTENLHMKFEADGKEIKSGETLNISTEGTHTGKLTATDDKNKSSTKEIKLENNVNKVVSGLDNLNNLNMQTDQEVNLLNGISFNGVELTKVEVEINGQRQQVSDPKHYTPNSAGTCKIIFTVKGEFGNSGEIKSKELTIKGPEYISPSLETANVIDGHYPWFNNLTQWYKELGYDQSVWNNKKNFVYPHILTSYITGERYRLDNMEYIIVGEIPESYTCEDVGPVDGGKGSSHADGSYKHIKSITPFSSIKASSGGWDYVINYISQHPEKLFMLSCAADNLGGKTPKDLKYQSDGKTERPSYSALKELLQKENVIISVASGNVNEYYNKILNENEEEQEMGRYNSSSVNSEKNNKITVVGYNPADNNIFRDDNQSRLPFGYGKGNIVIPFTGLVANSDNSNLISSTSSRPTATVSSTLGNYLSVIMRNHPGTTLEDANTIMQQKYLYPKTFKYKDTDGTIKNGGTRYIFNSDKFRDEELLHKSEIEAVTLSGDIVQLPSGRGLCYVGPGIQFEYKGKKYDFIEENKSKFMEIVANNDIKWYLNKESCTKYGGKGNIELNVYVLDTHGKKLPDVQLKVTKSVR